MSTISVSLKSVSMKYIAILITTLALLSSAVHASDLNYERIDYVTASHEESMLDMRVKVQGGYVSFDRTYKQVKLTRQYAESSEFYAGVSGAYGNYEGTNAERETAAGGRGVSAGGGGGGVSGGGGAAAPRKHDYGIWIFNRNWGDLVFLNRNLGRVNSFDESGQVIEWIDRNDFIYRRKNNGAYYEYQHNGKDNRITPTENGFRWSNREGDFIDYDDAGRATSYGNKNFVRVRFERNSKGLIRHIRDDNNQIIATWTYDGVRPVTLEDYTGRIVNYRWSGNNLTQVTTTRGHQWRYDYDTIGGNRVMVRKTDPEGQEFSFRYEISRGGFRNGPDDEGNAGTGSGGGAGSAPPRRVRIGDEEQTGGVYVIGRPRRAYAVESMLMLNERVYPDGKRVRYDYFYDRDTKTYTLIEVNSDGYERERWFDLDGELRQEFKGGLLAHRRIREGRRAVTTDPYGNNTVTQYTRWEAVSNITFADGATISVDYLANYNFPTLITDELGVKIKIFYDTRGNPVRIEHGVGSDDLRISEYEYDPFGNLLVERIIGDASTPTIDVRHNYDEYGNRVSTRDALGNTTLYSDFNALGQPQTMIDRRGNEWKATYDASGNTLTTTTPLGYVTRYEYDTLNRPSKTIDAEQREATYAYDSRDNLIRETNNEGNSVVNTYRMDGQVLSTTDESGQVYTARYDRAARLISNVDGTGNTMRFRYERGDELAGLRLQNAVFPNNQVFYTYDKRNRQIRERIASLDNTLADVTSIVFNARSEQTEVTDGNGNTTTRRYNVHGELTTETNAEGETVTHRYDRRGNLVAVTDAEQRITRFEYDANNNNVRETRPLGELYTFDFDENENLIRQIDPNGNTATYQFDADDRPVRETSTLPNGTDPQRVVNYTYDKTNLLLGYSDNDSSATYVYDLLGRLTEQTINFGAFSKTLTTSFHANSQIAKRVDAEDVEYDYKYDAAGKLKQLIIPNEGRILISAHQGYLPTTISFPGGTKQNLEYDGLGRIQRIQVKDAADSTLMDHRYKQDVIGNILEKTTLQGTFHYEYDKVYRLKQARQPNSFGDQAYNYDANGNRVKLTDQGDATIYQFNGNHELVRQETDGLETSYLYDRNGAVVEQQTTGLITRYSYNSFARLARVTSGSADTQQLVAEYDYDPFGRRIRKQVGSEVTYFLYDGESLVGEYDGTGQLITSYVYQPDSDAGSSAMASKVPAEGGGYAYRYHQTDHIDTPQQLIDRSGLIAWQGRYDAFGRVVETGNARNKLRFPGQYADTETGLNYNWNRHYNPSLGRYMSSDPIGLTGGPNTYIYALNNPVVLTDPTGEIVPLLIGGALWGAGISIGLQLIMNGGRFDCIDWSEVAMSALFGAGFNLAAAAIFRAAAAAAGLGARLAAAAARGARGMRGRAGRGAGAGSRRAANRGPYCFVAGTLINTDQGLRAIETIKVGDLVLSKNDITGEVEYKPVKRLFRNKDKQILNITLQDSRGYKEIVSATPEHPFWVSDQGWTEARNLETGLRIHSESRKMVEVSKIEIDSERQKTFNFEVEDFHTYFVGEFAVWVHNSCKKNARILRRNMKREGVAFKRGQAAGHIVASGGSRGHFAAAARSRKLLDKYGVGVNDAANGIPIGHPNPHNLMHTRAFHEAVEARLNNVVSSMTKNGYGARAIRSALRRELRSIGRDFLKQI